ncbi:phosphoesterase RecJ domain-containing protein [Anopheles sinensis]|uniref:Phosphoesterase RecJ domain-containing protein n=1 Tax=Anopheles sinensis TaxID=74873 RepID=A0A084W6M2_ANOSI|nr:phosphoesterase RecJ domain-containing protein [Anopheles sinensis]
MGKKEEPETSKSVPFKQFSKFYPKKNSNDTTLHPSLEGSPDNESETRSALADQRRLSPPRISPLISPRISPLISLLITARRVRRFHVLRGPDPQNIRPSDNNRSGA